MFSCVSIVSLKLLTIGETYPPALTESDLVTYPLLLTSGGHHWGPVQTHSLEGLPLLVLTSSDGHQNTYSWQAGGTYTSYWNVVLFISIF